MLFQGTSQGRRPIDCDCQEVLGCSSGLNSADAMGDADILQNLLILLPYSGMSA